MTKRCSHKPPVAHHKGTTKRRSINTKSVGRRPRFECLERRNLLTAGLDWGDTELLMATMLFEESPDVVEIADISAEGKVQDREFDLSDEPVFMAYFTADADMETDVAWYDDSEMPMFAMFSSGDFESDENFVKWDATDVELADMSYDLDDQPMLMRFSLANFDDDGSEGSFKTEFFDDWDSEVVDGELDLVGEPMLTAFFATDAGMEDDDLPQRMRFTAEESGIDLDEAELVDDDLDAEIMMFTAMGPSPWHNADNPEDVNVDGWATPIDALLIINGIGQDASSSTSLNLPVSLFLDVNGDRRLDASDAIQVINLLNGGGQLESDANAGADSRMAPLWYGEDWAESDLREDTEDSKQLDSKIWDTVDETDDPPRVAARLMDRSDESDDQSDEDGWIFSEDADWLLPELL